MRFEIMHACPSFLVPQFESFFQCYIIFLIRSAEWLGWRHALVWTYGKGTKLGGGPCAMDSIASKAQQAFSISKITGVVSIGAEKKRTAHCPSLAVRAWRQDGRFYTLDMVNQFWLSLAFWFAQGQDFHFYSPASPPSRPNLHSFLPLFSPKKCGDIEYGFLLKDAPLLYASVGFVGCKALAQGRPWFKHFTRCQLWVSCSFLLNACDGQLQVWCTHRDVSTTGGMKHSKSVELLNC